MWDKLNTRDSHIIEKILSNKAAIDLLNSTSSGETPAPLGSVERIVNDTVAEEIAKIIAGAPENFDTLKEISDWISTHTDSAATMNSAIQVNKNDLEIIKNILNLTENNKSERLDTLDSKIAALENAEPITEISSQSIKEICAFTNTLK